MNKKNVFMMVICGLIGAAGASVVEYGHYQKKVNILTDKMNGYIDELAVERRKTNNYMNALENMRKEKNEWKTKYEDLVEIETR